MGRVVTAAVEMAGCWAEQVLVGVLVPVLVLLLVPVPQVD
jgi:hypothetical protein